MASSGFTIGTIVLFITFGFLEGNLTLKHPQPAWLAFVVLVAIYILLVWFCFLSESLVLG